MKHLITIFLLCLCSFVYGQETQPTQTVRGNIIDQQSEAPLIGANIIVVGSDPFIGASSDLDGSFRLEKVPVGRQTLRITYLGYEPREIPNVLLTSGKEMIMSITLQESLETLNEVVIEGGPKRGEVMNKMATVSARTFSVEETKRFAGAIDDPSRMASSYAGVGVVDGDNDLVIRGNSPRGMLWRMEGIEIPNPNHFSNQGASGGPISMLNSNMMGNSEFFTGAFPGEFGNAFSGVFDISLRKGNNEQREYAFQFGILGTDMAVEGPMSRNNGGSYLINYRYSTLAMFDVLGIDIVGDIVPEFQDLAFNIELPSVGNHRFSLFGLGGISTVDEEWRWEEYDYKDAFRTEMGVAGIKHTYLIGDKTLFKTVGAVMGTERTYYLNQYDTLGNYIREENHDEFRDVALRLNTSINHKFNARHTLKAGVLLNRMLFDYNSFYYDFELEKEVTLQAIDNATDRYQGYAQWQLRASEKLTVNTGLHYTHFALNGENRIEPRFGARYQIDQNQSINAGIGMHSKSWDMAVYFAEDVKEDGSSYRPNEQLKMLQATHYVLGYDRMIGNDIHAKVEVYYQQLGKVPIHDSDSTSISALNSMGGYTTLPLTNKGIGYNYGAELTLEKYFTNQYFFMVTSSLFQSKYTAGDGIERNTRWNSNFVNNFQFGKEFNLNGAQKVLGFSAKGVWAGGQRFIPIDLVASREAGDDVYDLSKSYTQRMPDYFRVDAQITYRINKAKTTHTIKLDMQNATNRENYFSEYFNARSGEIERSTMLGILPVLSYKVQF